MEPAGVASTSVDYTITEGGPLTIEDGGSVVFSERSAGSIRQHEIGVPIRFSGDITGNQKVRLGVTAAAKIDSIPGKF